MFYLKISLAQIRVSCKKDVTKTGNGEWGMGNGEWEIENGKWEIENGKLIFF